MMTQMDAIVYLKEVCRLFKCKTDDIIYIPEDGVVYCINAEKSLIKRYICTFTREAKDLLPGTIHVFDAVSNCAEYIIANHKYEKINLVDKTFNPYMYEMTVRNLLSMYGSTIEAFIQEAFNPNNSIVIDSENIIEDPYYEWIFNELFSYGTGHGDIVSSKDGRYKFTIYKGLIPYLKSDTISLKFIDTPDIAFYTNFTVSKKKGILDVYTRNIRI